MESTVKRMTKNIKPFFKYYKRVITGLIFSFCLVMIFAFLGNTYSKNVSKTFSSTNSIIGITYAELTGKDAHPSLYNTFFGTKGIIRKRLNIILDTDRYKNIGDKLAVRVERNGEITLGEGLTINGDMMNTFSDTITMIGLFFAIVTFGYGLFNQMMRTGGQPGLTLISTLIHLIVVLCLVINGRDISLTIVNVGTSLTSRVVADLEEDHADVVESICDRMAEEALVTVYEKDEAVEGMNEASEEILNSEMEVSDRTWLQSFEKFMFNSLAKFFNSTIGYWVYKAQVSLESCMNCLTLFMDLLLPSLAIYAASLVTTVLIYSRSLEILVLCSLAPIAFGFMSEHGFSSSVGTKYIRNILALALQGVVIIVIMSITSNIIIGYALREITQEHNAFLVNTVIMTFVEVGMIKKSLEICQKVVGLV